MAGSGQDPAINAECLECPDLLRLGRQPRHPGMFEHVVEREEALHEHLLGGDPAATDVLGAERPVDPAPVDPAHPADAGDAGRVLLDGHALRDQGVDGAAHLLGVAAQKARPLRPCEDAAVEAG